MRATSSVRPSPFAASTTGLFTSSIRKDRANYLNYSGVGNTFNCNHPVPQKFIVDCLSYWVKELHVDGFRFDEGSILTRGEDGTPLAHPPVVWQVELDDVMADTKTDCGGMGRRRSLSDRALSGGPLGGMERKIPGRYPALREGRTRAHGSGRLADWRQLRHLSSAASQTPENSINFITCHDGFTLNDLVSYNQKHNEANGEGNRDGMNENLSWNCGVEGPTTDPSIEQLRARQIRNFAAILMLSRGVPMMLGGDELRRTQMGNNNAYNQDNETSWYDWTLRREVRRRVAILPEVDRVPQVASRS